eukprot:CAMPEP_0206137890 /NCGR_PEP_ID=MMETSP1473-20131121/2917_1 /ASSEMBLY_ACC=CAM_ASM_001109 /TAXON_ID=1461547 /ORGANISM="Stichococcus sp, Strain RCC1054" /LENGTH=445 /DNA_ID=CAMNT_0053531153 /DNA_START=278 /DNA_END=1615 /DNA_ORIENTATION=+
MAVVGILLAFSSRVLAQAAGALVGNSSSANHTCAALLSTPGSMSSRSASSSTRPEMPIMEGDFSFAAHHANSNYYLFVALLGGPLCRLIIAAITSALKGVVPSLPHVKREKAAFFIVMATMSIGILITSVFIWPEFAGKWGGPQEFSDHFKWVVRYDTAVFVSFAIHHILILEHRDRGLSYRVLVWIHHLTLIATVAASDVGILNFGFVFAYAFPIMIVTLTDSSFMFYHLSTSIDAKIRYCAILQPLFIAIFAGSNFFYFVYIAVHFTHFTLFEKVWIVMSCVCAWLPEQINWVLILGQIGRRLTRQRAQALNSKSSNNANESATATMRAPNGGGCQTDASHDVTTVRHTSQLAAMELQLMLTQFLDANSQLLSDRVAEAFTRKDGCAIKTIEPISTHRCISKDTSLSIDDAVMEYGRTISEPHMRVTSRDLSGHKTHPAGGLS